MFGFAVNWKTHRDCETKINDGVQLSTTDGGCRRYARFQRRRFEPDPPPIALPISRPPSFLGPTDETHDRRTARAVLAYLFL